jgi:hypothetical protein
MGDRSPAPRCTTQIIEPSHVAELRASPRELRASPRELRASPRWSAHPVRRPRTCFAADSGTTGHRAPAPKRRIPACDDRDHDFAAVRTQCH